MSPIIMTHTGHWFSLVPPFGPIHLQDISHALALLCRYTGHCEQLYSVAQHSLLVADLCPPKYKLEGLLHDAHEAYIGDVSSPLKVLLPDYQKLEAEIAVAVRSHFGLPATTSEAVHRADMQAAKLEAHCLMPGKGADWPCFQDVEMPPEKKMPLYTSVYQYWGQKFERRFGMYSGGTP